MVVEKTVWANDTSVSLSEGIRADGPTLGLTVGGGLGDLGLADVLLLGDGLCDGGEVRVRGPVW